ncbi:tyrosinase family protein [Daejeonella oryzae]|uniref:tyrosinase family protein n=1 Tax=Daejeonella oryzae TaxID=1122943 RepID=UPI00040DEA4D|nr:tyrosinase family protein [Daejeonella oryzae]
MKKIGLIVCFIIGICSNLFSQEIPILEIRINNTQTSKDDYASSNNYIECSIRMFNGSQINQNIPVLLRNIPFSGGGQLVFSSTGGTSPGSSTLDLIINQDNSFTTFYVKGKVENPSLIDKDAIIEVCDTRITSNLIVLGRKALMVTQNEILPSTLPNVEIQINSASTLDDYVTWSPTLCSIRLTNHAEFTSPVSVKLSNMTGSTGKINFASSSLANNTTATDSILELSLPNSGTWVNFYIAGKFNNASLRDKDAVIEVISGSGGVLTTITDTSIIQRDTTVSKPDTSFVQRDSIISIMDTTITPIEQLITVRDTVVSIRETLNSANITRDTTITGTDLLIAIKGTVIAVRDTFISVRGTIITVMDTVTSLRDSIIALRDTIITIRDSLYAITDTIITNRDTLLAGSKILSREGLMVRVRKNANNISAEERQRLLNAFVTFNNTFNGYKNFIDIHSKAGNPEEHNGPGFLAWHRAYILDLEREFQTIDPGVTLPYWESGNPAPNIFSLDFLGSKPITSADAFVDFNINNPLNEWNVEGGPGIRRSTSFNNDAAPSSAQSTLRNEVSTLALGTNYEAFRALEINPHGSLHNLTGGVSGDWMRSVATAVKDPIFFLLHSNVDRLWAKWQWINNRFDTQSTLTYSRLGSYPGSGTIHIGHYLNDTMWPWNGITGTYTGSGTVLSGNRPTTAPGGAFPNALSYPLAPVANPKPFDMINYRNVSTITSINSGLGFCYDDVPFQ